jgi:hypothetical protein
MSKATELKSTIDFVFSLPSLVGIDPINAKRFFISFSSAPI